jgi:hypothetical protein
MRARAACCETEAGSGDPGGDDGFSSDPPDDFGALGGVLVVGQQAVIGELGELAKKIGSSSRLAVWDRSRGLVERQRPCISALTCSIRALIFAASG